MATAPALQGHAEYHPLADRFLGLAQRAWTTYWRRKAERAAVFALHALDDRTLKDIGMDRSEIESVVYTAARGRQGALNRSEAASDCRPAERRIAMCM
jgi:uncharacterized protein YjiS (DUF1127 family)